MFTGLDPDSASGTKVVGRLVAAGILQQGKQGLQTTERWQSVMLHELTTNPQDQIHQTLEHTLLGAFPEMPEIELGAMARIMLFVEAREAGWTGE